MSSHRLIRASTILVLSLIISGVLSLDQNGDVVVIIDNGDITSTKTFGASQETTTEDDFTTSFINHWNRFWYKVQQFLSTTEGQTLLYIFAAFGLIEAIILAGKLIYRICCCSCCSSSSPQQGKRTWRGRGDERTYEFA